MAVKTVKLLLPALHPRQSQFVNDSHRIVVATCGSKTGKTFGMSIWLARHAWNNYQSVNWYCAPTLRQARTAFDLIGLFLPQNRVKVNRNEMTYTLVRSDGRRHSIIEFRSADNPSSLRGEGVHACVVDEAAYWSRASYESIWTTLTRTKGLLRVISTPKGRNWFYEEWCKGSSEYAALHSKFPQYQSYKLPTSCNPFIDADIIAQFKATMPEDVFRQEIEAEFLDESAGVFRNITNCQTAQLYDSPQAGHRYVVGADLAKHHDFTVFVVGDVATRKVVHISRFNETDWTLNVNRLRSLANRWNNAWVLLDSTGVGDVIYDELASVYPNTAGFSISTNAAKAALIQKLQLALEQGDIGIPKPGFQNTAQQKELAQVMDDELRQYSYHMSAQGKFQFSAPDGFHDDAVIGLALMNWQMSTPVDHYRARQVQGV